APPPKSIVRSRSFGKPVEAIDGLREAVSVHLSAAAERLRQAGALAGLVSVFILTNPFRKDLPQYSCSALARLPQPTDDTSVLLGQAMAGLARIFRPGYIYKKAGVMLADLSRADARQLTLFGEADRDRSRRLMGVLDRINGRMGDGTLRFASCGFSQDWQMRRMHRSPRYTTCWSELPVAVCGGAEAKGTVPFAMPEKGTAPVSIQPETGAAPFSSRRSQNATRAEERQGQAIS
ncbi:MAG: DUF4113 domain-containing protein, partial [Planctomycetota bacterium]|nr:DUF4113 domain-containing protein [Planctomycetota bacterium]